MACEPHPGIVAHLAATGKGLCRLAVRMPEREFLDELEAAIPDSWRREPRNPILQEAARQLRAYFNGELREFSVPLDLRGTAFQLRVWGELLRIPYGETRSYAWIARRIGSQGASRAVGAANGRNPVAVIVPCHRVVASDGKLGGYSGGLDVKSLLLYLEAFSPRA